MSERSPVSYEREMRARAERDRKGLGTVDLIEADGGRQTTQGPATEDEVEFLRWAAVWIMRNDVRPLPDLKAMFKKKKPKRTIMRKESP